MKLNEKQRQEIDKQIRVIENEADGLHALEVGNEDIVKDKINAATSRISDVMAGELGEEAVERIRDRTDLNQTQKDIRDGCYCSGVLKVVGLHQGEEKFSVKVNDLHGCVELPELLIRLAGAYVAHIRLNLTEEEKEACIKRWPNAEKAKEPEKKRYFFNPKNKCVLKGINDYLVPFTFNGKTTGSAGSSIKKYLLSTSAFEVTEADLPYLKKPEGEWEFRKPVPHDKFLDIGQDRADIVKGYLWAVASETELKGLQGYRWCKPMKEAKKSTVINEFHASDLKPRRLVVKERIKEILEAMTRYVDEGREVPEYWHDELSDKLAELKHGVMG